MRDDSAAPSPFEWQRPSDKRILNPCQPVVTICCFDSLLAPLTRSQRNGVAIVHWRVPPIGCTEPWGQPGKLGAVETLRVLAGYPTATAFDLSNVLFLHKFWRSIYKSKAIAAVRAGHAPCQWEEDVVQTAFELTCEELEKMDWRSWLNGGDDEVEARIRSFARFRCLEALHDVRGDLGDESRDIARRRVPLAEGAMEAENDHETDGAPDIRRRLDTDRALEVPGDETTCDRVELKAVMEAAIAGLTDDQRYVFTHRGIDDESRPKIAAALGIGVGRVRVLWDQAERHVRKVLALNGWSRSFRPD